MVRIQILLAGVLWVGCLLPNELAAQSERLFSLRSQEETGITFKNTIKDTLNANILIYEAFYHGGGVALGDINNDGLLDVYFTGNQVEDRLYVNRGELTFEDITESAGVLQRGGWSTGVTMIDINQDGWQDIYVCKSLYDDSPELRTNELYINNGDLTFREAAADYGLNDPWRSLQATFLDYDRDGDPDMFLVNQPPNPGMFSPLAGHDWLDTLFSCRLLRNEGEFFKDVSSEAGVRKRGYGLSATTADFNNDGWTDIYVCNDYDSPDFLYINQKNGRFENTIVPSMQHISNFSMGSDAADINQDGWMDLMVLDMVAEDNFRLKANMSGMAPEEFWNIVNAGGHRQYMFNTLQLNQGVSQEGQVYFSEIGQLAGVSSTDWSWAPLFADFDNDGLVDLFITNGIRRDLRNTDAIKKIENYLQKTLDEYIKNNPNAGEVSVWDVIDLEHVLTLMPSERLTNYMYRQEKGYRFQKVMTEWGMNQKTFSSGAAYGDLDNDGDLDLVINNLDEVAFVYENHAAQQTQNHYLRVKLTQEGQSLSFPGVRIEIEYDGQHQLAEISTARGFYSSSESLVHFGLGEVKKIDRLTVQWIDGTVSELADIKADQTLSVERNQARPKNTNPPNSLLFTDITADFGLDHVHQENKFDDYQREVLLPHTLSNLGPAMAVGDVNGDGRKDVYVGGAAGSRGVLWLQGNSGEWTETSGETWGVDQFQEDVGAAFLDMDNDGDLDLYIVSGGNEQEPGSAYYQDRLYRNEGNGQFTRTENLLPKLTSSGSKVRPMDFDEDGDIDLLVCGRQVPGAWPQPADSYLLKNEWIENGTSTFTNVTTQLAPDLLGLGMVTDALWSDIDGDNDQDILLVGVWMPVVVLENVKGYFKRSSLNVNEKNREGWYFSITADDLDGDGDEDYILGNLGLNYKYKASQSEPFEVYYADFDESGAKDIVLSYYNFGEQFPLRGRSCSSQQIPELSEKFPSYTAFASSTLTDVYGLQSLETALNYQAYSFESVVAENIGKGELQFHALPAEAQFSSVNDCIVDDFDQDGIKDLLVAGNLYGAEIETPRNDASMGVFLKGQGNFQYQPQLMHESGLCLPYEVKEMEMLTNGKERVILVATQNDRLRGIQVNR